MYGDTMKVKIFKLHTVIEDRQQHYVDFGHIPPANVKEYRGEAPLPPQTSYACQIHHAVIERDGVREEFRFCLDDPVINQIIYNTMEQLEISRAENMDLRHRNRHLSSRVKTLGEEVTENKKIMNKVGAMNVFQLLSWWRNLKRIDNVFKGPHK